MIFSARRAAMVSACTLAMLSAAALRPAAQEASACQVSLLALIVASQADPQDNAQYRSAANSVLERCSPAAGAKQAASTASVDVTACGKVAQSMLVSIEEGKIGSPQFAEARDQFAAQCVGK